MTPTFDSVSSVLSYDHTSGRFLWLAGKFNGRIAGNSDARGYVHIGFGGRKYLAHRLAWLLHHRSMPASKIDHINGNPGDNRLCNLREATQVQNMQNAKAHRGSITGLLGVTKHRRKYRAQILANGKKVHIGLFDTPIAASEAYFAAKKDLHDFDTYWERP